MDSFDTLEKAIEYAHSYDGAADYGNTYIGVAINDNGTFSDFSTDELDSGEMSDTRIPYLAKNGVYGYETIKGQTQKWEKENDGN